MSVGLEAFSLFERRHNVELQKKYPRLVVENVSVEANEFNPNRDYLHFKYENTSGSSPFHFLELIPDTKLFEVIDLLHFINWACYFHNKITDEYKKLGDYKSQKMRTAEEAFSRYLAEIIQEFTQDKKISDEKIIVDSKKRISKNGAILKPQKFEKICRFYARAWFEERFGDKGSVKFAYYVGKYILSNKLPYEKQQKCDYYRMNDSKKKEVNNLFKKEEQSKAVRNVFENINSYRWHKQEHKLILPLFTTHKLPKCTKLDFTLCGFAITLEKQYYKEKEKFYTIVISQLRCKHYFYKYARLYIEKYTSIF